MTHSPPPPTLADDLRRITRVELSLPARIGYVSLLLSASTMTATVTALLLTEPALPSRTSFALAVLALMGCSWIGFAWWVLTNKRILLGRQQIVASRLAVGFSSVFVLGAVLAGYVNARASGLVAAAIGLVMLLVAIWILDRAKGRFELLSQRRDELERQLARSRQ
jgi:hypothetical protein